MTNYNHTTTHQKPQVEGGIDIRQLIRRCRKYWYIFIIFPLMAVTLAWMYLSYRIPVYEVKSAILIRDEKNKEGISATDLISKELGLSGSRKMIVDESKMMASYEVIEKVVKDLKLDRSVFYRETLKNRECYGSESPVKIDSFYLKDSTKDFRAELTVLDDKTFELKTADKTSVTGAFGVPLSNAYGFFIINKGDGFKKEKLTIVCKSTEKAAREIIKSIDIVLPKKESNILEPTIKTTMPQKAKDILEKMVEVYNEKNVSDKKAISQSTLEFIDKRLLALTSELTGVEQNVQNYKTREGIIGDGEANVAYFFNKLDEYDSELVKLEVQNTILSNIEGMLTRNDPNFDLLPTNLELKSSSLQSQISEYNKLVLERNRLAKVAGDNNPTLRTQTEDIRSIKRSIIDNIGRVKQENASLLAQAKSKNYQFTQKLSKNPRNERELTDIKRQQNIKEGLYLFLLQKQEETAISMIGAVPDAYVINRPIVSDKPVSKSRPMIYLVALVIGGFLSVLFVFIRGLFKNTIETEEDIMRHTSMPILSKMPLTKSATNWVVNEGSQTLAAEMFRSLRSNLQYVLPMVSHDDNGQVLLVTSARSGEGKNFVCLNLGMSLAIAHKRTVIINLDLRRPQLASNFVGINPQIGITRFVTEEIYPNEIIQPSGKHDNLFYIHSGGRVKNPSELILDNKMGLLMSYLKNNFDYIIINSPPVGLLSDAFAVKSFVDMTLFVARLEVTKLKDVTLLNEIFVKNKLPHPTIVLNGMKWQDKAKDSYYKEEYSDDKTLQTSKSARYSVQKLLKSLF